MGDDQWEKESECEALEATIPTTVPITANPPNAIPQAMEESEAEWVLAAAALPGCVA